MKKIFLLGLLAGSLLLAGALTQIGCNKKLNPVVPTLPTPVTG